VGSPTFPRFNHHEIHIEYGIYHSMATNSRVGIAQVLLDEVRVVVLMPENRSFDNVPLRLLACQGQSPTRTFRGTDPGQQPDAARAPTS
jgi:phospholipase C